MRHGTITTKTCAYTNHTIMAEALEKWPIEIFSRLLPRIYQIVAGDQPQIPSGSRTRNIREISIEKDKMAIIHDGQVQNGTPCHRCRLLCKRCGETAYRNLEKTGAERFLRVDSRRNLTTRQTVSHSVVSCITEIRCWLSGYPTRSETTGSQI